MNADRLSELRAKKEKFESDFVGWLFLAMFVAIPVISIVFKTWWLVLAIVALTGLIAAVALLLALTFSIQEYTKVRKELRELEEGKRED